METFVLKYKLLFELKLLHHFFLDEGATVFDLLTPTKQQQKLTTYNIGNWLLLQPNAPTRALFAARRLVCRQTNTGLRVLAQVTASGSNRPLLPVQDCNFVFTLQLLPAFAKHTALPVHVVKNGKPTIYVFGNSSAALGGTVYPALALPPDTYSSAKHYPPGEIIKKSGKHYIALLKPDNQNKNVNNPDYWKELPANVRYATTSNCAETNTAATAVVIGQINISGKTGLNAYSLLNGSGNMQNNTFELRFGKL